VSFDAPFYGVITGMFTNARFFKCALQVNPAGYIKYRGQQQSFNEHEYSQKLLFISLEAAFKSL
tara:strand:- start:939 stop:1130 length:192 start_codon:yes stop_codon:yes gene_type:complete